MQTLKITITGKVQGVFFRAYIEKSAKEIGLKGWVKNKFNGSVEIIAQGSPEKLEALVSKCYQGSTASIVENVTKKFINNNEVFDSFRIK